MAKYAIFFTYSSDAWGRMIKSLGERTAAVRAEYPLGVREIALEQSV